MDLCSLKILGNEISDIWQKMVLFHSSHIQLEHQHLTVKRVIKIKAFRYSLNSLLDTCLKICLGKQALPTFRSLLDIASSIYQGCFYRKQILCPLWDAGKKTGVHLYSRPSVLSPNSTIVFTFVRCIIIEAFSLPFSLAVVARLDCEKQIQALPTSMDPLCIQH